MGTMAAGVRLMLNMQKLGGQRLYSLQELGSTSHSVDNA